MSHKIGNHPQRFRDLLSTKLEGKSFSVSNAHHNADIELNQVLPVRLHLLKLQQFGAVGHMFVYHTLIGGVMFSPTLLRPANISHACELAGIDIEYVTGNIVVSGLRWM